MTKKEIAEKNGFIGGFSIFSNAEVIEQKLYQAMQEYADQQLRLHVVGSNEMALPTKECVGDWYKEGDIDDNFYKHSTEWSNQEVVDEIHKALTYFIKVWQ